MSHCLHSIIIFFFRRYEWFGSIARNHRVDKLQFSFGFDEFNIYLRYTSTCFALEILKSACRSYKFGIYAQDELESLHKNNLIGEFSKTVILFKSNYKELQKIDILI